MNSKLPNFYSWKENKKKGGGSLSLSYEMNMKGRSTGNACKEMRHKKCNISIIPPPPPPPYTGGGLSFENFAK